MSAAHTPTPWQSCNDRDGFWIERQGVQIATVSHEKDNAGLGDGEGEANARRIVQCVNVHDELVAALQQLTGKTEELIAHLKSTGRMPQCFNLPALENARAAIAKVSAA